MYMYISNGRRGLAPVFLCSRESCCLSEDPFSTYREVSSPKLLLGTGASKTILMFQTAKQYLLSMYDYCMLIYWFVLLFVQLPGLAPVLPSTKQQSHKNMQHGC